jgi:hypothetical protein
MQMPKAYQTGGAANYGYGIPFFYGRRAGGL